MEIPLTMKSQESRNKHAAQKNDEKRLQERRRNLLYLIQDFLRQEGLIESLEILQKEAQLSKDIKICDNIDLETILTHYSDYYWTKFNKLPKFCKKIDNFSTSNSTENLGNKKDRLNKPKKKSEDKKQDKESTLETNEIFELCVTKIPSKPYDLKSIENLYNIDLIEKKLRSINDLYPVGSELREIAEIMTKEIISTNLNVHWSDIHGLEDCKKLLHETMIYPIKYPELFNGKFGSWQGILLYGPPGTGKTMLARAVATECKWTFFNITASSLISKWRGESEKYIRVLCSLAIHQAPSIIFIDEIDWITSENAELSGKLCEPARRFRAELLSQLDGLVSMENHRVVLLAATNSPWNLDAALLRRLDKHILVDLPDDRVRREILENYTEPHLHTLDEFNRVILNSVDYSGSDLKQVCKEAWMMQVRRYIEAKEMDKNNIHPPKLINSVLSLQAALQIIYPTAQNLADKYHEWKNKMKKKSH